MEAEEELQYEGEGPPLDFLCESQPLAKEAPNASPSVALRSSVEPPRGTTGERRRSSSGVSTGEHAQPDPEPEEEGGGALDRQRRQYTAEAAASSEAAAPAPSSEECEDGEQRREKTARNGSGRERDEAASGAGGASSSVTQDQAKHTSNLTFAAGGGGGRRQNYRVIAHNLDRSIQWQELKDFGRQVGDVKYATVFVRGGEKIGVLEYSEVDAAEEAVRCLDGARLGASRLRLSLEMPRPSGSSTGPSSGGVSMPSSRPHQSSSSLSFSGRGHRGFSEVPPESTSSFVGGGTERGRGMRGSRFFDEPPTVLREPRPPVASFGVQRPPPPSGAKSFLRAALRRSSSEERAARRSLGRKSPPSVGGRETEESPVLTSGSGGAILREAPTSAVLTSSQRRFVGGSDERTSGLGGSRLTQTNSLQSERERPPPSLAPASSSSSVSLRESSRAGGLSVHAGYRALSCGYGGLSGGGGGGNSSGSSSVRGEDRETIHSSRRRTGAPLASSQPFRVHLASGALQLNGEERQMRAESPASPSTLESSKQSSGTRFGAAPSSRTRGDEFDDQISSTRMRQTGSAGRGEEETQRLSRNFSGGGGGGGAVHFSGFHSPPSSRSPERGSSAAGAGMSRHFGMGATQRGAPLPPPRRRSSSPGVVDSSSSQRRTSFQPPPRRPPPCGAGGMGGRATDLHFQNVEKGSVSSPTPPPPPGFGESGGGGRFRSGSLRVETTGPPPPPSRRSVFYDEQREGGSRRFDESRMQNDEGGFWRGSHPPHHHHRHHEEEEPSSFRRHRRQGGGEGLEDANEAALSSGGWRGGNPSSSSSSSSRQTYPPAPPPLPPDDSARLSRHIGMADSSRPRTRDCGASEGEEDSSRGLRGFSSRVGPCLAFDRRDPAQRRGGGGERESTSSFPPPPQGMVAHSRGLGSSRQEHPNVPPVSYQKQSDFRRPAPPRRDESPTPIRGSFGSASSKVASEDRPFAAPPGPGGGSSAVISSGSSFRHHWRSEVAPPSLRGMHSHSSSACASSSGNKGGEDFGATNFPLRGFGGGPSRGRDALSPPPSRRLRGADSAGEGPAAAERGGSAGGFCSDHRKMQMPLAAPSPPAVRSRESVFGSGEFHHRPERGDDSFERAERRRRIGEGAPPPRNNFDLRFVPVSRDGGRRPPPTSGGSGGFRH